MSLTLQSPGYCNHCKYCCPFCLYLQLYSSGGEARYSRVVITSKLDKIQNYLVCAQRILPLELLLILLFPWPPKIPQPLLVSIEAAGWATPKQILPIVPMQYYPTKKTLRFLLYTPSYNPCQFELHKSSMSLEITCHQRMIAVKQSRLLCSSLHKPGTRYACFRGLVCASTAPIAGENRYLLKYVDHVRTDSIMGGLKRGEQNKTTHAAQLPNTRKKSCP